MKKLIVLLVLAVCSLNSYAQCNKCCCCCENKDKHVNKKVIHKDVIDKYKLDQLEKYTKQLEITNRKIELTTKRMNRETNKLMKEYNLKKLNK